MDNSKSGYFYIIPAPLVEGGDLTKAILFGLINSLLCSEGYCWASNEYLAKKMGRKNKSIISKYLSELEQEGWIEIEIDKNSGNKRKIWGGIMKKQHRYNEKTIEGYNEKTLDSNINKSNKIEYFDNTNVLSSKQDSFSKEIAEVIDVFVKTINPTIGFGNKTQRKAAKNLIDKFGPEKAIAMAKYAVSKQGSRFAPVITSPCELFNKVGQLVSFKMREEGEGVIGKI